MDNRVAEALGKADLPTPAVWLRGTLAEILEACDEGKDGQPRSITDANQLRGTMVKYQEKKEKKRDPFPCHLWTSDITSGNNNSFRSLKCSDGTGSAAADRR